MSKYSNIVLPTCVILDTAKEELDFKGTIAKMPEFELISFHVLEKNNTTGVQAIKEFVKKAADSDEDFVVVLVGPGIYFTNSYQPDSLIAQIIAANERRCDILFGGIIGANYPYCITENLFWIDQFSHSNLFIIFRRFFGKILDNDFNYISELSGLSSNKLTVFPFITISGFDLDRRAENRSLHQDTGLVRYYDIEQEQLKRFLDIKTRLESWKT